MKGDTRSLDYSSYDLWSKLLNWGYLGEYIAGFTGVLGGYQEFRSQLIYWLGFAVPGCRLSECRALGIGVLGVWDFGCQADTKRGLGLLLVKRLCPC